MKLFIVLALFAVSALAAPLESDAKAEILVDQKDNIGTGPFANRYETSNGISASAEGQLVNEGTENEAQEVRGSYSYTGPDGILYLVEYSSGVNGFQPRGAHIPQ